MLKLFYSPGAVALASHIALEESGLDYETVRISFGDNEQKAPEYLKINPKGRVPSLVTDRGILTETPAILVYISQLCPEKNLAPLDDSFAFAEAQSFNNYLCSTVHVAHAHGGRGHRWADQETSFADMKQKVPQTMTECFELIEDEMVKGPWVLGDVFSVCDMYLYTVARWLTGDQVDIRKFDKVAAISDTIEARPATARTIETHFA
jgi:glutathione S-transferase